MTLKINGNELELVYSFRSHIFYEQITGHPVDFKNIKSVDLLTLFFCCVAASLQKAKQPVITMDDFMDVIDDNGGEKAVIDFSNWYIKQVIAQYEILSNTEQETKETNVSGPQGAKKKKV